MEGGGIHPLLSSARVNEVYSLDYRTRRLCATAKLLVSVSGSRSSPDEYRLLKHLFNVQNEPDDLLTTPIHNISDHVDVDFALILIKLIALVKSKDLLVVIFFRY